MGAIDVKFSLSSRSGRYIEKVACLPRNDSPEAEPMHHLPTAKLLSVAITTCLGMASVTAADAAPKGTDEPGINAAAQQYLELDVNADGRITEVEVLQERTETFKKLDTDGDGAITLEEVRAMFAETIPATASEKLKERGIDDLSILFIDSMDQNDDGRLEIVEFQRPARQRFRQIDANSDGFVTPGETTVFFSRIRL